MIHDVLALSVESRAELMENILESLSLGPDKHIDALWEPEIERRIDEVDRGVVDLILEDSVFEEIWPLFKKSR